MHQKKSEIQIIKESRGVSSDFNPTPPHNNKLHHHLRTPQNSNNTPPQKLRPISSLSKQTPNDEPRTTRRSSSRTRSPFLIIMARTLALTHFLRHFRCAHLLRLHFRFLILLSLPSLYFTLSNPRRSFLLNALSLLLFLFALMISLNLALPRLLSIRLFLARSLPTTAAKSGNSGSKPVLWSIGSKPISEKRRTSSSGTWVKVYTNGDVYEGEVHKGKCSGSGVYYYHMSGRYEGDWIDEKYDGYGVETWARGSRYRGQYRRGLRHGIGVYRFYTGDVFAGEWSNGQCHGCGVHTCEDGSKYFGEFKWGVKHGLGHYHFR